MVLYCTQNTFDSRLHPCEVLNFASKIGYSGIDLSCDGAHFPYENDTVRAIIDTSDKLRMDIANVNSMTTEFFWREQGKETSGNASDWFKGPDIVDKQDTYEEYGIKNPVQWRVDRIMQCIEIALKVGAKRVNLNIGTKSSGDIQHLSLEVIKLLEKILKYASKNGINLCVETEPSLFISNKADFEFLNSHFEETHFLWGFDVGHQIKSYRGDSDKVISDLMEMQHVIGHIHLEDIARADWEGNMFEHTHLCPGDGDIDFVPILDAVSAIQRERAATGQSEIPVYYENYHANDTDDNGSARRAFEFFSKYLDA